MKNIKTIDLAYIALFAVIIAICSWISIPSTVPFTLQTFAVFAAMLILGSKKSFYAIIVYILLGAIGLPVFSGFKNGAGVLLGTTGGYVIGFIFMPLIYMLFEKYIGTKPVHVFAAMITGLVTCYAFGTAWFMIVYAQKAGAIALGTALMWCVVPFIIPDLLKMTLAYMIAKRVKPMLK